MGARRLASQGSVLSVPTVLRSEDVCFQFWTRRGYPDAGWTWLSRETPPRGTIEVLTPNTRGRLTQAGRQVLTEDRDEERKTGILPSASGARGSVPSTSKPEDF